MNRGRSAIVLGTIMLVGAGIVWLLVTAGGPAGSAEDRIGDVIVTRGSHPPKQTHLADLKRASVTATDGAVVFEAAVEGTVPESFENEGITFRWEIVENGQNTWIVSASVVIEPTASVVATQFDYRVSTIDRTLPGELDIDGSSVRLTLESADIERFPESFSWTLETELDGNWDKAASAVARDVLPNEGSLDAGT